MRKKLLMIAGTCVLLTGCASAAADSHTLGMELYEKGSYDQASQYLLAAVAEDNANGAYYVDLGMNYLALSDYSNANDAFEHAVSMDECTEAAYRGLGISYMEQELYDSALEAFNSALSEVELDIGQMEYDILQYMAQTRYLMGDYQTALETYEKLLKLDVSIASNSLRAGQMNLLLGNDDAASKYFDQAVAESEDTAGMYFSVYNVYSECGQKETGANYLNKALEVEGDSGLDHLNRGKVYYLMGNYSAAVTELSYALDEGQAKAAVYTAFCYEDQGDYDTACEYYVQALNIENDPLTANYYAMCLSKNNDDNHAWNVVHTTMEQFPDAECMQDLKWNEIILYERLNMMPSALTRLMEYEKAYPDDPNIDTEMQYLTLKVNNSGDSEE